MYEPVLDNSLSTSVIKPTKYPSFTQIYNFRNLDLDNNFCEHNNNREECPPVKPPRRHQRRLSLRNSFSGGEHSSKMKNGGGGNSDFIVDVDHIEIGLRDNSKKTESSYSDVGVQTTHLVPYRLRFWPRTDCDFKISHSDASCMLKCHCCMKLVSQWILSQVGLTIIVITWALLGAYAFFKTEGNTTVIP
ncbi:uncharacterized protein LOC115879565 [Sitophilus oryzae]|uniref:Uncharacterized protein LOC115879565 n=1 Tax=Sitophilus oryzae TaxID=7048 RepID=A0A6J2XN89_SITOR|nr:uncharacterized protein LOC115879565 [Sitophilus oryzae]